MLMITLKVISKHEKIKNYMTLPGQTLVITSMMIKDSLQLIPALQWSYTFNDQVLLILHILLLLILTGHEAFSGFSSDSDCDAAGFILASPGAIPTL